MKLKFLANESVHHKNILKILSSNNRKLTKSILSKADRSLLHKICEISDNILQGKIKLKESDYIHSGIIQDNLSYEFYKTYTQNKKKDHEEFKDSKLHDPSKLDFDTFRTYKSKIR